MRNTKALRRFDSVEVLNVAYIIFVLLLLVVLPIYLNSKSGTVTATVTDKGIKPVGKEGSVYMIYTDKETFCDSDALLRGKFDSSDVYGKIQIGRTYTFDVVGVRCDYMSMYRNILHASQVPN